MKWITFQLLLGRRGLEYFYDDHIRDKITNKLLSLVRLNNKSKDRGLSGKLLEMAMEYHPKGEQVDFWQIYERPNSFTKVEVQRNDK